MPESTSIQGWFVRFFERNAWAIIMAVIVLVGQYFTILHNAEATANDLKRVTTFVESNTIAIQNLKTELVNFQLEQTKKISTLVATSQANTENVRYILELQRERDKEMRAYYKKMFNEDY